MEVGFSRAVLAGRWKLIVTPPVGSGAPCTNPHGDSLEAYLRELTRIAAASDTGASPKQVFSAVSAARKSAERRDLEVRLLYSGFLRHPASYCDAVQLYDTAADPAEQTNLAARPGDATTAAALADLATQLAGFVRSVEPLSTFRLPPTHEWRSSDLASFANTTPWK